ncbi:MAG: tRNA pseudouridine(55) synthase TruB [Aquificaceae bacterium]
MFAILLDKPRNITSTHAIESIRKRFKVKAGHTGTLDPLATGLLIVLVNEATRFSDFFLKLSKSYLTLAKLGEIKDTYDDEGSTVEVCKVEVSCEDVNKILSKFLGKIEQRPPAFCAKKIKGKRAYRLARKGIALELKPVEVEVFDAELKECALPYIKLYFRVSSGTYIRSLVHDIGLALRCGAYLKELRRISIGNFSVDMATKYEDVMRLESLQDIALPIDKALSFLHPVRLTKGEGKRIRHGMAIDIPLPYSNVYVRVYEEDRFLGVGCVEDNMLRPYRLLPEL